MARQQGSRFIPYGRRVEPNEVCLPRPRRALPHIASLDAVHPVRAMCRPAPPSSIRVMAPLASTTVDLARIQFATTSIYHFLFVPLTLGLAPLVAVMQTLWFRSRDDAWLWLTRFFGAVFGAPLAIEGLAAFMVEATFLGLWIFGWNLLPRGLHLCTIWVVALAT